MLSRFVLLAAFLAASLSSAAEPQSIPVWTLKAGHYTVVGGKIVNFPPSGPVVPPPDDPVVPPPVVPVATLTKAVTDAVNAIPASDKRHAAAVKVSGLYQMIGSKVEDDTLPFASAGAAVAWMLKPAIGVSDAATWDGVNAVVEKALSGCQTKAACVTALNQAASAVTSTVPASEKACAALEPGIMLGDNKAFQELAKVYGIDWNAFLMTLLELFLKFLPHIISAVEKVGFLILFA
jgi:hypothetical protein